MEKRHSVILVIVAVATLVIAVIGATFAYFANISDVVNSANVEATTGNTSTFTAYATDDIAMNITSVSMQESNSSTENVSSDTATLIVKLVSGNDGGDAMSCSYDIKYVWDGSSLSTTESNVESWAYDKASAELPLEVDEVTYPYEFSIIVDSSIENDGTNTLDTIKAYGDNEETFTSSKENNFTTLLGEDNLEGTIISNAIISTNSANTGATITYTIKANFYNLPTNQNALIDKTFKGHFEVTNVVC